MNGACHRLAKKIEAGVDFIQTQCIYNMEKFREWIRQANDMGLTEKVYILAGVTPMKSVGMARYMKNNVPGMDVPDEIIKRLQGVRQGKSRPRKASRSPASRSRNSRR